MRRLLWTLIVLSVSGLCLAQTVTRTLGKVTCDIGILTVRKSGDHVGLILQQYTTSVDVGISLTTAQTQQLVNAINKAKAQEKTVAPGEEDEAEFLTLRNGNSHLKVVVGASDLMLVVGEGRLDHIFDLGKYNTYANTINLLTLAATGRPGGAKTIKVSAPPRQPSIPGGASYPKGPR